METVFEGKEVKRAIDNKRVEIRKSISSYMELEEINNELLKKAEEKYNSKNWLYKFFNNKPTIEELYGFRRKDYIFYEHPICRVWELEKELENLNILYESIKDDSQVILNEQDMFNFDFRK